MATHANDAIKLIENPTDKEKQILSKFKYKTETPIFAGLCEILGKFSEDIPFKEFYEHGILKVIHKLVNETEFELIYNIVPNDRFFFNKIDYLNFLPKPLKLKEWILNLKPPTSSSNL